MQITIEGIRRGLVSCGYLEPTLGEIIIPWLQEKVLLSMNEVRVELQRWQLTEIYTKTICQNVVASNAIEGEKVECDECALLIHAINEEIKKRFKVVSVSF